VSGLFDALFFLTLNTIILKSQIMDEDVMLNAAESLWSSDSGDEHSIATVSGTYDPVFNGTFKQQVNFLLTSRERLQLTKAIQIYAQRR